MDTLTQPFVRLVEAMQTLVTHKELRLLHVITTDALRLAALEHIAAEEHNPRNQSPFVVLEAPTEADDDGWSTRAGELRQDFETLRDLVAQGERPVLLPPLSPEAEEKVPLLRFALDLSAALRSLREPLDGLVIVLSPVWVRDPKQWMADVKLLVTRPTFARVRWVVVDLDQPLCEPVTKALGSLARSVDVRIDEAAARTDFAELLEAMESAPVGATGARLAGAAGPGVQAPLRTTQPLPLGEARATKGAEMAEKPADPELSQHLRRLVLVAAKAMRDGKAPEGVGRQREARDQCLNAGLVREAVRMELVLGAYLMQAGVHENALAIVREARRRAEVHGLADLAVQAQLALAAGLLVLKRKDEAPLAYAEAGRLGVAMGSLVLAIEGYRMCGQLLALQGHTEQAGNVWWRALEVAAQAPSSDRKASLAPETARALAALCRRHGLMRQADSLEAQALLMEALPEASPSSDDAIVPAAPTSTSGVIA